MLFFRKKEPTERPLTQAEIARDEVLKMIEATLLKEGLNQEEAAQTARSALDYSINLLKSTNGADIRENVYAMFSRASAVLTLNLARERAPTQGITFHGPVSKEFHDTVVDAWRTLPESHVMLFNAIGEELHAGRMGTDVLPEETGKTFAPNKDAKDDREYLNQTSGVHFGDMKKTIVTEYRLESGVLPTSEENSLSERALFENKWVRAPNRAETTRHEFFHGLDTAFFEMTGTYFSSMPDFRNAYQYDLIGLGGYKGAHTKGYHYFASNGKSLTRDLKEIFAEMGAQSTGGSLSGLRLVPDFPRVAKQVQALNAKLTNAYERGLGPLLFEVERMAGGIEGSYLGPKMTGFGYDALTKAPSFNERNFRSWFSCISPEWKKFYVTKAKDTLEGNSDEKMPFAHEFLLAHQHLIAEKTAKAYRERLSRRAERDKAITQIALDHFARTGIKPQERQDEYERMVAAHTKFRSLRRIAREVARDFNSIDRLSLGRALDDPHTKAYELGAQNIKKFNKLFYGLAVTPTRPDDGPLFNEPRPIEPSAQIATPADYIHATHKGSINAFLQDLRKSSAEKMALREERMGGEEGIAQNPKHPEVKQLFEDKQTIKATMNRLEQNLKTLSDATRANTPAGAESRVMVLEAYQTSEWYADKLKEHADTAKNFELFVRHVLPSRTYGQELHEALQNRFTKAQEQYRVQHPEQRQSLRSRPSFQAG